jgi:hypothetical protein
MCVSGNIQSLNLRSTELTTSKSETFVNDNSYRPIVKSFATELTAGIVRLKEWPTCMLQQFPTNMAASIQGLGRYELTEP